jgi:hypothetical protein
MWCDKKTFTILQYIIWFTPLWGWTVENLCQFSQKQSIFIYSTKNKNKINLDLFFSIYVSYWNNEKLIKNKNKLYFCDREERHSTVVFKLACYSRSQQFKYRCQIFCLEFSNFGASLIFSLKWRATVYQITSRQWRN